MTLEHFDREGKLITMDEWAKRISDAGYCLVNRDIIQTLSNLYRISTVWLGTDYSHGGDVNPRIFETAIFTTDEVFEDWQWRYSTEKEAWAGHARAVAIVEEYLINGKSPG